LPGKVFDHLVRDASGMSSYAGIEPGSIIPLIRP
jgi:hypothetical protein